jgi:dephospho-CoA kinase
MVVIGLAGRACAGKNRFAEQFGLLGCLSIDVDLLGHEALCSRRDAIGETFGQELVRDGKVDRKALGALVFSDPAKLRQLESIVHPAMVERCAAMIAEARDEGRTAVVINAALLHRMGLDRLCDRIVFVSVFPVVRFFRSRKRDRLSLKRFLARERAQRDIRPGNFAKGIPVEKMHNNGPAATIHRQVVRYCARIGIGNTDL